RKRAGGQVVHRRKAIAGTEAGCISKSIRIGSGAISRIRMVDASRGANHGSWIHLVGEAQARAEALLPLVLEIAIAPAGAVTNEREPAQSAPGARVGNAWLETRKLVVYFRIR